MERSGRLAYAASVVALTAVYFAVGWLGLSLTVAQRITSPVWPASGIAVAGLLLLGPRVWPAIAAGSLLVNWTAGSGVATALGIAAGATLEAVAGAWLVRRFAHGRDAFDRPQDVFKFVVLAGLLATGISATFGVSSLVLGGFTSAAEFGRTWLTWWLANAGGVLVVAPAVICWIVGAPFACGRAQLIEAVAFLTALLAVGTFVFGFTSDPLRFLCLPLTIWTAFRFGQRGTAMAVLILSGFAVWGALSNSVPGDQHRQLLLLQVFMGVISATSLTLAAVVGERGRALEALESQARELERSNAELAAFADVVSHDLKAPLRGIASLAEWIVEDNKDLPDESAEQLRLLDRRTRRMSKLIDGVLAYSRVTRRRRALERVDAGAIVSEVIDSLGDTRVSIRVEGSLPGVRYDRTQLTQVFQNLIANAVQHMGRQDGEVVISCQERHEAFEFAVSDDGVGIEELHTERVFRLFQALQPERETTGVGLTIVKKIVEMHGGTIRMEPTPGGGATFRFSVPRQPRDLSHERG